MCLFSSGLESVSGLRDVLESRMGQYTLICLICRQRRRVPATTGQSVPWSVAVVIGFAYSLVNSLLLLAGLAIIVSSG